jgi:uncharacterized membrane protein YhdT
MVSSNYSLGRSPWHKILLGILAVWMGACLLLDALVMPTMYGSGLMQMPGFASAGYSLFSVFNRVELLSAAVVLSGALLLRYRCSWGRLSQWAVPLAMLLLTIVLVDTYGLTPHMGAAGLNLNWFQTAPTVAAMPGMHAGYWTLELLKLFAIGVLVWGCDRALSPTNR